MRTEGDDDVVGIHAPLLQVDEGNSAAVRRAGPSRMRGSTSASPTHVMSSANIGSVLSFDPQDALRGERGRIAQTTLSFMDEFELINGVPAFVLEPDKDDDAQTSSEKAIPCNFTCHALSKNGKLLVAGDNKGRIHVWGTDNFHLVKKRRTASRQSVGCVQFLADSESDIVYCDILGQCEQFSLNDERDFCWVLPSVYEIQEHCFVEDKDLAIGMARDPDSTSANIWAPTISADGIVVAQAISTKTDQKSFVNSSSIFLSRQINRVVESACVTAKGRSLISRYCLSDNGSSLLVVYAPPRHPEVATAAQLERSVEVWPAIRFDGTESRGRQLPCRMGSWGEGGKFVIGWTNGSSMAGKADICVWKTTTLVQDKKQIATRPHIRLQMEENDTIFQVEIVSPIQNSDNKETVLAICFAESDESNIIIHIWSSKLQAVLLQFDTGTLYKTTLVGKRQYLNVPEVMSFYWGHNELIVERSLIKMSISPDKKWIAFYSSEGNSGFLWSRDGAIPVAKLDLPADLMNPRPGDPNPLTISTLKTIAFDPSGTKLMLIGQDKMIAFVPAFLQKERGFQMEHVQNSGENYVTYSSLRLSDDGSTMMLSGEAKPNNVSSICTRFGPAFLHVNKHGLPKSGTQGFLSAASGFRRIPKDYTLSSDGAVVAYIFVDNTIAVANVQSATWDPSIQLHHFQDDCHYKIVSRSHEDVFNRIFFVNMPDRPDQLVCFCLQFKGSVCWFDPTVDRLVDRIPLSVNQSLGVKLNGDRNRAVVLGTQTAQVIDLHRKEIIQSVNYNLSIPRAREIVAAESDDSAQFFFDDTDEYEVSIDGSMILIGWDSERKKRVYLKPGTTSKKLMPYIRNLKQGINNYVWLSGDTRWLVVASEHRNDGTPQKGLSIYDTHEKRQCRRIPDNLDTSGSEPLFDVSGDGRIIVMRSIFPTKRDETSLYDVLVVLTPYAIEGSIPDYHRLKVTRKTRDPNTVNRLIADFSWPLLNHPDSENKSLFQHSLTNRMSSWIDAFYELGKKEGIPINLFWNEESAESGETVRTNVLQWAIDMRSSELVWDHLTRLIHQATTVHATASIIRSALSTLYMTFPALFLKLMESDMLIASLGTAPVAAKIFETDAYLVGTDHNDMSWNPKPAAKVMQLWKSMGHHVKAETIHGKRLAEVTAEGKFVLVKDVAQVGMRGIIRHLLMLRAPSQVFKCHIMRWAIAFKWEAYGRKMCINEFIAYLVLLVCFIVYSVLLGRITNLGNCGKTKAYLIMIPLLISVVLGLWNIKGEITQLRRYMKDSKAAFNEVNTGRLHYLQSQWNWMEMISYGLMFPLTVMHILAVNNYGTFDHVLSICAAIDCLLLSFKILYFLQAFRSSGPLVLAIREVVLDILIFFVLMLMILFGFAVAFNVMFRHSDELEHDFGEVRSSMLLAYVAVLGDFDLDVFREAKSVSWFTTAFFVLYMFIMMIMLLNLLIGIMGDSFDRVRSEEEAEFLKGKAIVIDDFEAGLSDDEIEELENKIGTYLHALVPLEKPQELDTWTGKIKAFENVVEKRMAESEHRVKKEIQQIRDSVEELKRAMAHVS